MKRNLTILVAVVLVVAWYIWATPSEEVDVVTYETEDSQEGAGEESTPLDLASAREGAVRVTIVTDKGDIVLDLYPNVAPKTVDNFVTLAADGFYDGILFHRVIAGFMIQAGDPLSKDDDPSNDGTGDPGYAFEDEINPHALGLAEETILQYEARGYQYRDDFPSLPVDVGAIAMANSGPNTNGSQFFIVTEKAQPHLDGLHTVFGEVVEGMSVVLAIAKGDAIETVEVAQGT